MSEQPPNSGPHRSPQGAGLESPRVSKFLAVAFTVAATGSLVLVALDFVIGLPPAGDMFITFLNALAAFLLWRKVSKRART